MKSLSETLFAVAHHGSASPESGYILNFGKFIHESSGHWLWGASREPCLTIAEVHFVYKAIDPISFCVKAIEAEFVLNVEQDKDAARHPDGQTGDVDEGINLLSEQIADGDGEVVAQHSCFPCGGVCETFTIYCSARANRALCCIFNRLSESEV